MKSLFPLDTLPLIPGLAYRLPMSHLKEVVPASTRRSPVTLTPQTFQSIDVDRDGYISPVDALLVINYLNGFGINGSVPDDVAPFTATSISPVMSLRSMPFS